MDHRVFQFATRGQCIKEKSWIVLNTITYFVLNCNVLALLSFYAVPSGGNRKTRWSIVRNYFCWQGNLSKGSSLWSIFEKVGIMIPMAI